jgi:hypothetical protein
LVASKQPVGNCFYESTSSPALGPVCKDSLFTEGVVMDAKALQGERTAYVLFLKLSADLHEAIRAKSSLDGESMNAHVISVLTEAYAEYLPRKEGSCNAN